MKYLLDSTALLAFYFGEPGSERVQEILIDEKVGVGLSVLTAAEFWGRLRAERQEHIFDEVWRRVSEMMTFVAPVSLEVVRRSFDLRAATTSRLPQMDALIAATAVHHTAVLVHRDPHFLSIPGHILQQESL